ncbi:hypothetical protein ABC347_06520 [Sphingomonas sp. 1P06PA]|uniref:hypothetical protein n=1 Tax=Sphingomonas sp. 1P06PA TaxID=554121 RepID=UPI0039A60B8E
MRHDVLRGALIGAALIAAPAIAAPSLPSTLRPAAPPSGDVASTLAQAIELGRKGDCQGALALLDPLSRRLPPGDDRNRTDLLRLGCLGPADRVAEIAPLQRALAEAIPKNGVVRSYGVMAAALGGRFADAGEQLAGLAEEDPASLRMISGEVWRGIVQKLTEEDRFPLRDRLFIALARADWQPTDRPELRDSVAQGAIDALLDRKEVAEAELLLPRIEMPEILFSMATERQYQPLWPAIEARMGPASGRVVDRFAAQQLAAFTTSPDDPRVRRDTIRAFILLGRYAEAGELADGIAIGPGMSEDAVRSVLYHGQALAALGRRDAAIALVRPFGALDIKTAGPGVAGVVNLAELLDEAGQPDEALAVARRALAGEDSALSPWGRGWLRRTEVCALSALGRSADVRAASDAIKATASENEPAAIEALLCANRADEAAALAIKTLGTREGASNVADQFQPEGALWAPAKSRLRALWEPLLARADVKAAFERSARILPQPLWPARQPRPIPRVPGADPNSTT